MNHSFLYYLAYFSAFSSAIPLIIGYIGIKKNKSYLIPLFIFINVSFLEEIFLGVINYLNYNNLYVIRIFTIIEFILISLFYHIFFRQFMKNKSILFVISLFLIVAFIDYKFNGLELEDNFCATFKSIVLTIYALFAFLYVMKYLVFENLLASSFFWFNTAILVFYSGRLLLVAFGNYLSKEDPSIYLIMYTVINSVLAISYNILITIGFWKVKTT